MAKKIEIDKFINKTFGYLTIKEYLGTSTGESEWLCSCKCGSSCNVKHSRIKKGETKSCGCLRKELVSANLIGQTFSNLTVISRFGYKIIKKDKSIIWECLCKCGKSKKTTTALLKNGHVKSCGCEKGKKIKDITSQKFGELTAISFHERKNKRTFWLCQCSCGQTKSIDAHHLLGGSQKSCGCRMGGWKHGLTKNKTEYYRYIMSDPVKKLRHTISRGIRDCLKQKKEHSMIKKLPYAIIELKLYLESLWEPWMNWENYGGRSNDKRKTWWIDHIIPSKSFNYTSMNDPQFLEHWSLSNLRPLEKIENIKKGSKLL